MLLSLNVTRVLTTLDLSLAYHQIPLNGRIPQVHIFHHSRRFGPIQTDAIWVGLWCVHIPENDAWDLWRDKRCYFQDDIVEYGKDESKQDVIRNKVIEKTSMTSHQQEEKSILYRLSDISRTYNLSERLTTKTRPSKSHLCHNRAQQQTLILLGIVWILFKSLYSNLLWKKFLCIISSKVIWCLNGKKCAKTAISTRPTRRPFGSEK